MKGSIAKEARRRTALVRREINLKEWVSKLEKEKDEEKKKYYASKVKIAKTDVENLKKKLGGTQ